MKKHHIAQKCMVNVVAFCHQLLSYHDDAIKRKHFPRYWPFVPGIHRLSVNSPHKGQWRGALIFFFDLRLKKRLGKQSRRRWFETPSRSLWRHCNVNVIYFTCRLQTWHCENHGSSRYILCLQRNECGTTNVLTHCPLGYLNEIIDK